jgi:hypothetical protein
MTQKERKTANAKKQYAARVAAGICGRNGRHGAAEPGKSCCIQCLREMAARHGPRRQLPRRPPLAPPLAPPKKDAGGCTECGRYEPMSWSSVCWVCANQAAQAA